MSAEGWVLIISAVFLGLTQITGMVLSYMRDRDKSSKLDRIEHGLEENTEKTNAITDKVDTNTEMTARIEQQTNGPLTESLSTLQEHDKRITALEADLKAVKVSIEGMDRNLNSTRHEMRGHLQSVMNKLDILGARPVVVPVQPVQPAKDA